MSATTNNKVTQETAPDQDNSAQETAPDQDNSAQEAAVIESPAQWSPVDWLGKPVIACDGKKIGKLHDVYVDVETDLPQFGTVKKGFFRKHLTFVPLVGVTVSPGGLQVTVTKEQVREAPNLNLHGQEMSQEDESTLYHHFKMNYIVITNESGRRLARR
jgi:hypothetical protein